jgi:hypothetical protein
MKYKKKYDKKYYIKNKERILLRCKKNYIKNKERILKKGREYYQKNKKIINKRKRNYQKLYCSRNKEKILKWAKKARMKRRDKFNKYIRDRLKTDIKRIENALDKIMTLQGITYTSVENKNKEQNRKTGLIAQEVNQVLPEATSINSDGYYSISYGNLAGLIIEAIKELKTEINELKSRIT